MYMAIPFVSNHFSNYFEIFHAKLSNFMFDHEEKGLQ